MANFGKRGDVYVARFRIQAKEYKKSLKTANVADAKAAMHSIGQRIHRLVTGLHHIGRISTQGIKRLTSRFKVAGDVRDVLATRDSLARLLGLRMFQA
jgi:hypothetical protein